MLLYYSETYALDTIKYMKLRKYIIDELEWYFVIQNSILSSLINNKASENQIIDAKLNMSIIRSSLLNIQNTSLFPFFEKFKYVGYITVVISIISFFIPFL